jgi:serine/threonine protein phosphatase 1
MSKIYVIGDIHGQLNKLNNLLDKLDIQPTDTIIFLGDYVDRGPDSYGVIERLLQLNKQCNCTFLAGNHDVAFFDDSRFRADLPYSTRYSMWNQGARETYKSYTNVNKDPSVHYKFYEMLQPYHILEINNEKHFFVHGGYNRHVLIEKQKNSDILWWDRDLLAAAIAHSKRISDDKYPFKNKDKFKYIYVGHTPVTHWGYNKPTLFANVFALDTGVGKYSDAQLYAVEVNSHTIID